MRTGLSLLTAVALVLVATAGPTAAQTPISVKFGVLGGMQAIELSGAVDGNVLPVESGFTTAFGAEFGLGLPIGVQVGVHYLRHMVDIDITGNVGGTDYAAGGELDTNEIGVSLEKHIPLVPMSPAAPYLGAGLGYSRMILDAQLADADEDTGANVLRLYGVAGVKLVAVGVQVRAGYAWGELENSVDVFGAQFSTLFDYEGFFGAASLSFGVF